MSTYTCQHCDFTAASRDMFPNSEHVCKNCMRDRPIAWKTIIYILARQNTSFPEELKAKPVKRAKAKHVLHNLSNPPAKQLITRIKFDTILFKEWTQKKLDLQDEKGGQCAYTDACLDHMLDWMSEKRSSSNLVIHESDISQCYWHEDLSSWPSPSPTSNTPASAVSACDAIPISSWEIKYRKQQRKKSALQKQFDDLQRQNEKLLEQNRKFEIKNETMVALVKHLTEQLIANSDEHTHLNHV
jgi:hypothetical protein